MTVYNSIYKIYKDTVLPRLPCPFQICPYNLLPVQETSIVHRRETWKKDSYICLNATNWKLEDSDYLGDCGKKFLLLFVWVSPISYPESYRLFGQRLISRRDWRIRNKFNFFDWLPRNSFHCFTAQILRPAVIKFQLPRVSPGDQPLAKEHEDSWYEIGVSRLSKLNQWESKLNPIVFSPHAFSRTWCRLHVFASNSDWLVTLFTSIAIGQSNYAGFGFTTLIWKPLQE